MRRVVSVILGINTIVISGLGRIKLTIQDTLESNIDQEEIRVLPTVANVLSRITERTKDGITEIEKVSEEK